MNFWKKFFDRKPSPPASPTACDFCQQLVVDDDAKVGMLKGPEILEEFEEKLGLRPHAQASHRDPDDGEPLFFACDLCLMRYQGICSRCGSATDDLSPTIVRGDITGKEARAALCEDCLTELVFEAGGNLQ